LACYLLHAGFLLGLLFNAEDGGDMFLRDVVPLYYTAARPAVGPTQPLIQWVPANLSPEVKQPTREADDLLSFTAEVKNDGAIYPLPQTRSWRCA
jgi:hypothetical protein